MRESKHFDTVAVVIPSYREKESLKILVRRVRKNIPESQIIIVDDSPPDEGKQIHELFSSDKNISVLARGKKLGRGSAVLTGFAKAIANKRIQYVFEMDSDLSHNPVDCHKFLKTVKSADCVIGSRYLKNSYIFDWPFYRLIVSKLLNFLLNVWLGLNLTDYTNGFRLYRRVAVRYLLSRKLKETGFIALSESIFRLKEHGFTITEVPIEFTYRKFGSSSVGISELVDLLLGAIRIRLGTLRKH